MPTMSRRWHGVFIFTILGLNLLALVVLLLEQPEGLALRYHSAKLLAAAVLVLFVYFAIFGARYGSRVIQGFSDEIERRS